MARKSRQHEQIAKATHYHPVWTNSSVLNILHNKSYTGCLVMHKTVTRFPGKKQRKATDSTEHIIIDNTHESIISVEKFNAAQLALVRPAPKNSRQRTSINHSVLTGKLICGHCGRTMIFRLPGNKALCPQYNLIGTSCPDTRYLTADIENDVLVKLQNIFRKALLSEKSAKAELRNAQKELRICQRKICYIENEIHSNRNEKTSLYEQYILGDITPTAYQDQKQYLNNMSAQLQEELFLLKTQENTLSAVSISEDIRHLAATADTLINEPKLTREMVLSYVDSIIIYNADDYKINWRYSELFNELLSVPNM